MTIPDRGKNESKTSKHASAGRGAGSSGGYEDDRALSYGNAPTQATGGRAPSLGGLQEPYVEASFSDWGDELNGDELGLGR